MASSFVVLSWNIRNIGKSKLNVDDVKNKKKKNKPPYLIQEPGHNYITEFIAKVIENYRVDVIGITEVRGGEADVLMKLLKQTLPDRWSSVASSQQAFSRAEQVLYLWREQQPNSYDTGDFVPCRFYFDTLHYKDHSLPSPASLYGIIDDNSMGQFFVKNKLTTKEDQQKIYTALVNAKYIYQPTTMPKARKKDNIYRVKNDKWSLLSDNKETVNFDGDANAPTLTDDQSKDLTEILVNTDIVMFPWQKDRPPFQLALSVANDLQTLPILFSLMHAPQPKELERFSAAYNYRLCAPLKRAKNVLVMGDFNIADSDRAKAKFTVYDKVTIPPEKPGDPTMYKYQKVPGGEQTIDPFLGLTNPPVNTIDLIGGMDKTTVKAPNTELDFEDSKSEDYDKFFFKSEEEAFLHFDSAGVIDLTQAIYQQSSDHNIIYNEDLSKLSVKYFKTRMNITDLNRTFNNLKKKKRKKTDSLDSVTAKSRKRSKADSDVSKAPRSVYNRRTTADQTAINLGNTAIQNLNSQSIGVSSAIVSLDPATVLTPPNINSMLAVYGAISDHLPICVELYFASNIDIDIE